MDELIFYQNIIPTGFITNNIFLFLQNSIVTETS